jgi:hypothetical protein
MMMQMQLMKKDGEAWFKRKRSKKSGSEFGEDHVIKEKNEFQPSIVCLCTRTGHLCRLFFNGRKLSPWCIGI